MLGLNSECSVEFLVLSVFSRKLNEPLVVRKVMVASFVSSDS